MNYRKNDRIRYGQQRENACLRLNITKYQYNTFRRWGEQLRRIYEMECNGFDSPATELWAEKHVEQYYQLAKEKAQKLSLHIYFQTDPRGATIYLDKQPIPDNNYTQAVCIY